MGKGCTREAKEKVFFFFGWVLHIALFFEKRDYRSSFKKFYTPGLVKRNYKSPLKKLFRWTLKRGYSKPLASF